MRLRRMVTSAAVATALGLAGMLGGGSVAAASVAEPAATSAGQAAQSQLATWHQVEMWYDLNACMFSQMFKAYPTYCAYGQWGSTASYGYVLWGWY